MADQSKSRRGKRRDDKNVTAGFNIPNQESTTSKMKLSLLVLSLVIIYGTCIIYAAEVKDVDSTEDVTSKF